MKGLSERLLKRLLKSVFRVCLMTFPMDFQWISRRVAAVVGGLASSEPQRGAHAPQLAEVRAAGADAGGGH